METVIETTPTSTPETTPAAPATSAPSPTPSVSQRPASAREAFERIAAQESPTPAVQAASATQTPAGEAIPSAKESAPLPGYMSVEQHQQILNNQRTKAAAEAVANWRQQYGWAEQIPQPVMQQAVSIAQRVATDPIGFVNDLIAAIEQHPVHGPALRSRFGAGNQEPQPDVEIVDQQGNPTGQRSYSAQQLAKRETWREQRLQEQFNQQLAPLRNAEEQRQAQVHAAEHSKRVNEQTDSITARLGQIVDAKDANDPVWTTLSDWIAANPQRDFVDVALAMRKALLVPAQQETAKVAAAADMRKKALGNTANGTGSPASAPVRPRNAKELAKFMERLDGASA